MGAYASFVTLKLFLPTPTVFLIGYWDHLLTENYVSTSYYVKQDDFFQLFLPVMKSFQNLYVKQMS